MTNPEVELTLDDAVAEVLNQLTGLDLEYLPEQDRYRSITRQLNRALRSNALENEWGYYASRQAIGIAMEGQRRIALAGSKRPRIINDDAITLVDDNGLAVRWAYFLPRDALHKYGDKEGLWCTWTRQYIDFSRPFMSSENGLTIEASIMREPEMFRLPDSGDDVPNTVRNQPIDFDYPDVIVARAAFYYAQTDPVMQPRVQTLEAIYKDLMYQLIERDTRMSESPYINETLVPVESGLVPQSFDHRHPHANDQGW